MRIEPLQVRLIADSIFLQKPLPSYTAKLLISASEYIAKLEAVAEAALSFTEYHRQNDFGCVCILCEATAKLEEP